MSKANQWPIRLAETSVSEAIPAQPIDPPTITVTFGIQRTARWPVEMARKFSRALIAERR